MDRLFQRVASQDAEGNRDAGGETKLTQAQADLAIDMLIVRRFTPDHGTQAEDGGELSRVSQPLSNQGDFPGTGNPGDRDRLVVNTGGLQRLQGSLEQLPCN